ncbi:MAG: hypothetical protein NZ879_07540 [Archaeoglobaceae archaeon]|nr:hypothetical protein [Archaeoglobaceae archaeon]MDW8118818.1 hypothetical protein [Archaeoglobaceae archaeon]
MEELAKSLSKFLDEEDQKILRTLSKDPTVLEVLKKVFEEPEKAEKYLILIRDNYSALLFTTKLAERISRYLEKEDEEKGLNIFLKGIGYLTEMKDRRAIQSVFSLLKEAIDRRLALGKFETAAKLVTSFKEFGFSSYIKKLLFHVIEVSESKDFARAIKILELLPTNEDVLTVKSYILLDWGKSIAVSDPEAGLRKIEEALKIKDLPSAKIAMAEIYESIGNYLKAYEIYSTLKNQPEIERKLLRLLIEWGEETKDLNKLEEAKILATGDIVLVEEIDRRIKKIKEQSQS